jgi:hypothetical protein
MTLPKEADDCLLTPLRDYREPNLALLDVKNRIRNVTLPKNNLILLTFDIVFPSPTMARNTLGSKDTLPFLLETSSLFLFTGAPARSKSRPIYVRYRTFGMFTIRC